MMGAGIARRAIHRLSIPASPRLLSFGLSAMVALTLLALSTACGPRQLPSPTATPQPPPTSTPTPRPSATSEPTAPPTSVPLPQASLPAEPPAWLRDPAADVLAVAIGDRPLCWEVGAAQLRFLNVETGEQFELDVSPARAMMWLDSDTFGLLAMDGQGIVSVDLANAVVEASSLEAEDIRLVSGTESQAPEELGCAMQPVELADGGAAGEGRPVFISPRQSYSADLSLFAELGTDEYGDIDPFLGLEIRRVGSGELVWSADPDDEYDATFEYEFAWSLVEPNNLAVVECGIGELDRCILERLYIVDVVSGEELASYPGEFMDIAWSPDGRMLLYTSPEWVLPRVDQLLSQIEFAGPPCVLDVTTGENECFDEVLALHFPEGLTMDPSSRQVTELRWDRSSQGFHYLYRGVRYELDEQGALADTIPLAGLCHMDLGTRRIDCPSEDVPELQGVWIDHVVLSPNQEFAYVQAGWEGVVHGVLDLARDRFYLLPGPSESANLEDFDSVAVLWRPTTPVERPAHVQTSRPTERDIELVPSIWTVSGLLQRLDLAEPGVLQFSMDLDADVPLIWPYFWCASDEQRLAENLQWIAAEFAIDGTGVAAEDILEHELDSEEWSCHYWATKLTDWQNGSEVSLAVQLTLARSVYDGHTNYPAGKYRFELGIRVSE